MNVKTPETMTLTIEYLDGKTERYEFAPQSENALNAISRFKRILDSGHLMLELENESVIIFLQNVRRLHLSPPPQRQLEETIRNVRQLS
ncbi:hypothetical protein [Baaleninema simplex]|uniref:hypothetical protein n=1 Tax=Baaleninema simplex TaxID=2862350 RepID=UPI00034B0D2B|nr:hypothetical protein [Baaleninema simplex]